MECQIDPNMNATIAAQYQAQCDAYIAQLNSLHIQYENCVAEAYFINFHPYFVMSGYALVVMLFTSGFAGLLVALLDIQFKKKKIREKRSIAEKLRIVQFWKLKEIFGFFFAMVWISGCIFYLFMFAVNTNTSEYASNNAFAMIQQWVTPFGSCFGIFLIVAYGATSRQSSGTFCNFDNIFFLFPITFCEHLREEIRDFRERVEQGGRLGASSSSSCRGSWT